MDVNYLEIDKWKFKVNKLSNNYNDYSIELTENFKENLKNNFNIRFSDDKINDSEFDKILNLDIDSNIKFRLIYVLSQFSKNRFNVILNTIINMLDNKYFEPMDVNNYNFLFIMSKPTNNMINFSGDCAFNVDIFIRYNSLRYVHKYFTPNTFKNIMKQIKILDLYDYFEKYFDYQTVYFIDIQNSIDYIFKRKNKFRLSQQLLQDKLHYLNCCQMNKVYKIDDFTLIKESFSTYFDNLPCIYKYAFGNSHAVVYIKNGDFEILYDLNTCLVIPIFTKLNFGYYTIFNLYPSEFNDVYNYMFENNYIKIFSNICDSLMDLCSAITQKFTHTIHDLFKYFDYKLSNYTEHEQCLIYHEYMKYIGYMYNKNCVYAIINDVKYK